MPDNKKQSQQIKLKIDDENLKGKYANAMQVTHTKEEFILDFMNLFPPQGTVTARVIASPGHIKRIIAVLKENIAKYEAKHGKIKESAEPNPDVKYSIN